MALLTRTSAGSLPLCRSTSWRSCLPSLGGGLVVFCWWKHTQQSMSCRASNKARRACDVPGGAALVGCASARSSAVCGYNPFVTLAESPVGPRDRLLADAELWRRRRPRLDVTVELRPGYLRRRLPDRGSGRDGSKSTVPRVCPEPFALPGGSGCG